MARSGHLPNLKKQLLEVNSAKKIVELPGDSSHYIIEVKQREE